MQDVTYEVALSVLNGLVGCRFAALQQALEAGEVASPVGGHALGELKKQFQEAYDLRDNLRSADPAALQSIIDKYGPVVRQAAASQPPASHGLA